MWRQLAWATPDLWDTLYLRTGSWSRSSDFEFEALAKFLPDLVREWLERSGSMPLTIFFNDAFEDNSGDDDTVEVAIGLIIGIPVQIGRAHV